MNIFVTGGTGFIGKNIYEYFNEKYTIFSPSHVELDLLDENAVSQYIKKHKIGTIIHCANRGGDRATTDLSYVVRDNLRIFFNIVRHADSLDKIIYFGSGAEYDKNRNLSKIKEEEFGQCIPKDDYGFYKYVCANFTEKSKNIINLRLFGVFGKYENCYFRFISNAIVRNILGLDIILNQNVVFDYIYIQDLLEILDYFIKNKPKHKTYNLSPNKSISLLEVSDIINSVSSKKSSIKIINDGLNYTYSGDNSRLKTELGDFKFSTYRSSIRNLFDFYKQNMHLIDDKKIASNEYLNKCSPSSSLSKF
ncbi:MAG TPA: NAD-dependent epimerase/dehydratase family protein [Candidatus Bilamarchaeaceae archaeon]|nr:NAD-dependent epimerase/dehydratase family protein [Candidatus Bilamarchaeaceae archaeon]